MFDVDREISYKTGDGAMLRRPGSRGAGLDDGTPRAHRIRRTTGEECPKSAAGHGGDVRDPGIEAAGTPTPGVGQRGGDVMCALSGLAELPVPKNQLRIVVGVDGSEASANALEWAIDYARRSPAVVDVVTAWTFPMVHGYARNHTVGEVEDEARKVVTAAMSHVAEEAPDVVVRGETADGEPGPVLVDAAKGADLLVVGARGESGLQRLFLGSVSSYCAKNASCSVMVVR
jgi:nucleotide-binding universal stress UspA family protein